MEIQSFYEYLNVYINIQGTGTNRMNGENSRRCVFIEFVEGGTGPTDMQQLGDLALAGRDKGE